MDISIVCLAKDNADLLCHCPCSYALAGFPVQQECPWAGSGWTFACLDCGKPFTFALGVEEDMSWEELATRDLMRCGILKPSPHQVRELAEALEELMRGVKVGRRYVYLDGVIIPADADTVRFTGWHARHDFDFVPQVKAMTDPSIISEFLRNPAYWGEHVPRREE